MEKECSSPSVSVFHTNPTTNTLEGCERFRFGVPLPLHLDLGNPSEKYLCTSVEEKNKPSRTSRPALAWPGRGSQAVREVDQTERPPRRPWGLRLNQADPRRPNEAPSRSRASKARLAPRRLGSGGRGRRPVPRPPPPPPPRMGKVIPGRIFEPLQG